MSFTITVTKDPISAQSMQRYRFEGKSYTFDPQRKMEPYTLGDLICDVTPFFGIPFRLGFAIRSDGNMAFREWSPTMAVDATYIQTIERLDGESPFHPTEQQIDTISGLFSRRLNFEGLYLPPGASLMMFCPPDVADREEKRIGHKIYLS